MTTEEQKQENVHAYEIAFTMKKAIADFNAKIDANNTRTNDNHTLLFAEITAMKEQQKKFNEQLAPVTKAYQSVNTVGEFVNWIFKSIAIPFSIIVSIWIGVRKIKAGL